MDKLRETASFRPPPPPFQCIVSSPGESGNRLLRHFAKRLESRLRGVCRNLPHPLIPADAGIHTLPNCMDVPLGKGWFPASAGTSGGGTLSFVSFLHTHFRQNERVGDAQEPVRVRPLVGCYNAVYWPDCPRNFIYEHDPTPDAARRVLQSDRPSCRLVAASARAGRCRHQFPALCGDRPHRRAGQARHGLSGRQCLRARRQDGGALPLGAIHREFRAA